LQRDLLGGFVCQQWHLTPGKRVDDNFQLHPNFAFSNQAPHD
jgi:hypothetical protein